MGQFFDMGREMLIKIILGLLIIMMGGIGAAMLAPPVENVAGLAHPSHTGMRIGGDGAARLVGLWLPAFIVQTAALLSVAGFVLLGIASHHRTKALVVIMAGIGLLTVMNWGALLWSYNAYLSTGDPQIVFGFPLSTQFMMLGFFLIPLLFCTLYVAGFKSFIYSDEDKAAFEDLLREVRERGDA